MYLSRASVQISKFARLRTAFKFASASFEVRKTSDGCIRNCPYEPTLSESDCEPTLSESDCESALSESDLRTWLRSSFLRTWLRSSISPNLTVNLYLPNSTYELDRFRCKCFVPVHQRIAYIQHFWFSLVPSSCMSHTSSSAESFIRMTIQFALCATTWHLHDPKLLKLRKPFEVPPAPKLVFIPQPSTPRLPPISETS